MIAYALIHVIYSSYSLFIHATDFQIFQDVPAVYSSLRRHSRLMSMWTNRVVAIIGRKNGSFLISDGRPLNFPVVAELSPFASFFGPLRHQKISRRSLHSTLKLLIIYPSSLRLFVLSFCFGRCADLLNGMTDPAAAWDQYYCRWL